jgi:hypothetical protein
MRRILITLAALALAALAVPAAASAHHGPRAGDRNRDGLPDRWERQHHLSLRVNQAHRDPDHDGLDNRKEFEHGTDPRNRDTNDNGVGDRNEIHPVGTIASFNAQNGALTITLADGQAVTGQVTPATRIECRENENENENEHPNGDNFAVRHGDGGGDNSGPGSGGGDNSGPGSGGGDNTNPPTTTSQQPNNSGPGSANSGPGNAEQGQQPPAQPGDRDSENCVTAAGLVRGTPVRDAEARLTANGLVFEELELGRPAQAPMPQQ